MSKPVAPQKGPTKIDLNALRELATKAGYDLVPAGRMKAFHVEQAVDPLRVERQDYRDAIRRSFVRQAADWILQDDALSILYGNDGIAATASGTLVVVMPAPLPAAPATDQGDVL